VRTRHSGPSAPTTGTVLIAESLLDSHMLWGMANTETDLQPSTWLDTTDGPLVIEVPPHVLGIINDFWGRYVTDVGNAGPDRGEGGKYLLLPPGYTGPSRTATSSLAPGTFGNFGGFRGFLVDGDPRPAVASIKQHFRVRPLARAADPPAMTFVDISGVAFNCIPRERRDRFLNKSASVVAEEPLKAIDPETRGLLAAIGIRKHGPSRPRPAHGRASSPRPQPSATPPPAPLSSARRDPTPTTIPTAPGRCSGSANRLRVRAGRGAQPRCADASLLHR